jgi:hypothetical protein
MKLTSVKAGIEESEKRQTPDKMNVISTIPIFFFIALSPEKLRNVFRVRQENNNFLRTLQTQNANISKDE